MRYNISMPNKTEQELIRDLKKKKMQDFLKEVDEAMKPIQDKYSMRLIPRVLNLSDEYKVHYEAAFAVQEFKKEEIKLMPKKPDETLDAKPETHQGTDTNNKVSEK